MTQYFRQSIFVLLVAIAQLVERFSVEEEVVGAKPTGHPLIFQQNDGFLSFILSLKN